MKHVFYQFYILEQGFQTWIGPEGQTVKIENRDENRLFKHKEPDF